MKYIRTTTQWAYFVRTTAYTFVLLLLQIHWIARLPHPSLRIDLLLPLMFGVAMQWSPLPSLLWACFWGFIADTFSGKFWGFHVISYVIGVCLVEIAVEKFEFHNPIYQMCFVGVCAFCQSLALGAFVLLGSAASISTLAIWHSLVLRSIFMGLVAPLVIYPVWGAKRMAI